MCLSAVLGYSFRHAPHAARFLPGLKARVPSGDPDGSELSEPGGNRTRPPAARRPAVPAGLAVPRPRRRRQHSVARPEDRLRRRAYRGNGRVPRPHVPGSRHLLRAAHAAQRGQGRLRRRRGRARHAGWRRRIAGRTAVTTGKLQGPKLGGKVAIVTGAALGMGNAVARRFTAEGANVVVADIREAEGKALADELGPSAVFAAHDVSDEASWRAVVDTATATFGGVDVLINNAGIWRTAPLVEQTAAGFDEIVGVNLRGVFLGMRAVAEPMRERGGGAIVNT